MPIYRDSRLSTPSPKPLSFMQLPTLKPTPTRHLRSARNVTARSVVKLPLLLKRKARLSRLRLLARFARPRRRSANVSLPRPGELGVPQSRLELRLPRSPTPRRRTKKRSSPLQQLRPLASSLSPSKHLKKSRSPIPRARERLRRSFQTSRARKPRRSPLRSRSAREHPS